MQKKYSHQQTQKKYIQKQNRKAVEFHLSFGDRWRAYQYIIGHHRARLVERHRAAVAVAVHNRWPVRFDVVREYPELIIIQLAHKFKK